jgi:hypothetical protein
VSQRLGTLMRPLAMASSPRYVTTGTLRQAHFRGPMLARSIHLIDNVTASTPGGRSASEDFLETIHLGSFLTKKNWNLTTHLIRLRNLFQNLRRQRQLEKLARCNSYTRVDGCPASIRGPCSACQSHANLRKISRYPAQSRVIICVTVSDLLP